MITANALWLFGASVSLSAQTVLDSLYEKTGARHGVHISKISDTELTFTYPNESLAYTWKLDRLVRIRFASGRIQNLATAPDQAATEKPETKQVTRFEIDNNAKPWEDLIITYDSTDVANMKYKGPIRLERSAMSFDFGSMFMTRTMNDLRREAYNMNATHVLIVSKEDKVVSDRVVKTKIQAKAYR